MGNYFGRVDGLPCNQHDCFLGNPICVESCSLQFLSVTSFEEIKAKQKMGQLKTVLN